MSTHAQKRLADYLATRRTARFLLDPNEVLTFTWYGERLLLADSNGKPISYDYAKLIIDALNEAYGQTNPSEITVAQEQWRHTPALSDEKALPSTSKRGGIVYLLRAANKYKIGCTTKPIERRIAQLRRVIPWPISIVAIIKTDNMIGLEDALHERFADKRESGEWFALNDDDVQYIMGLETQT